MYVIFTDTDTDITPEKAAEYGYHLISMPYTVNGKDVFPYVDFDKFDSKAFYSSLRKGLMPKTSGLSPETYYEAFAPFFKEGKDILYAHFSAAMSGTFAAMNIALERLKEEYPERKFYSLDTKGITIGSYNIVCEVGQMYKDGKSAEEIMKWAETEVDKFATYFFVEDLSFFRRSGRVSGISAIMGNLIGIRPIITMNSEGKMASCDKARGRKQVIAKIMNVVEELQEDIYSHKVILAHSDYEDAAKELENALRAKFGEKLDIEYVDINPTAGSHCGPNGVGVNFHAKHR